MSQTPAGTETVCSGSTKIVIMNANGPSDERDSVKDSRREAIQQIVINHQPALVLFQEFTWLDIRGEIWEDHPIPDKYEFKKNKQTGIMYDSETCTVAEDYTQSDILRTLQFDSVGFCPEPRMCARKVTTSTKPSLEFLCISWHGRSNKPGEAPNKTGGSLSKEEKNEYFKSLMGLLKAIREKFDNIPMLVGGDYNVDMQDIKKFVPSPFKLCTYEGSDRRKRKGIIDFCIITDGLEVSDTKWLDLNKNTSVDNPDAILDHDPLIIYVDASTSGATGTDSDIRDITESMTGLMGFKGASTTNSF